MLPDARSQSGRWRHAGLTVLLFLTALLVLGQEATTSPFEGDEADYVATSRYFGYLFLEGDPTRPEWDSNHWTRTQPPLTRYIIGAWLTINGYDLDTLNQPYVSTASSVEVNRRKGRVPTDDVLAAARQPMVVLGAGAIALLYPLGVLVAGSGAGLAAVALALTSTFLRYTFVHAWAEAPLAFFLVLSALLSCLGVKQLVRGGRSLVWAGSVGLTMGLASTAKLTGLVGLPIVVVIAAIAVLRVSQGSAARLWRRVVAVTLLTSSIMLVVMIGLNPFLWRGPVVGFVSMLQERQQEMADQQEQWPEYAVWEQHEKLWQTAIGSTRLGPWGDDPLLAVPLGFGFAAIGLVAVTRRHWGHDDRASVSMLAGWLLFYAAIIVIGLRLSYPRYFLPTCLLFAPFVGAGIAVSASTVGRRLQGLLR